VIIRDDELDPEDVIPEFGCDHPFLKTLIWEGPYRHEDRWMFDFIYQHRFLLRRKIDNFIWSFSTIPDPLGIAHRIDRYSVGIEHFQLDFRPTVMRMPFADPTERHPSIPHSRSTLAQTSVTHFVTSEIFCVSVIPSGLLPPVILTL
jgi:hypothetical protein